MSIRHFRPELYREDGSRICYYSCYHPELGECNCCPIGESTCSGCRYMDPDRFIDNGESIPGDHFLLSIGRDTFEEMAEDIAGDIYLARAESEIYE